MSIEPSPTVVEAPTSPEPSDHSSSHAAAGPRLRLATAVVFVTELDRSVEFYRELLGWEVTVRDATVALLASEEGFQMYVHSRGTRTQHPVGQIGIQYLIWTASDEDGLSRCLRVLGASPRDVTRTADGFTMVEGRDPDGVPILVTYPGPADAPRHEIIRRAYAW